MLAPALWVGAAAVAVAQCWAALSRQPGDRLVDLHVYWGALRLLFGGGELYDFAAGNGAPFTYPPFAALVLSPVVLVDEGVLRWLWTAATVAVVGYLAWLVASADGVPRLVPRRIATPLVALLLFASAPVSSNIRFGQVSVFLVVLILIDCLRVAPSRWGGVATGAAAAVKLTPLIFVPFYWFAGRRRACLTALGSIVAGTLLAWLVLPKESVRFWFGEIWNVDRVGNIATGGNQSINGVLLRLDAPDAVRTVIVGVLGLAVVAAAMVRAVRAYRNAAPLTAAVIVGAAGLAVSPVSWTHHQVWLVLAALLAVSHRRRTNLMWAAAVAALMILPVTSIGAGLPGGVVTGNARVLLALAVAVAVPFVAVRRVPAGGGSGGAVAPASHNVAGGQRPASID